MHHKMSHFITCISGWLSRRSKEMELSLFVQVTAAVFISQWYSFTCTNKDNSHFLSLLNNQLEIYSKRSCLLCYAPMSPIILQECHLVDLCGLCWHNFEHNRYAEASSIMPA